MSDPTQSVMVSRKASTSTYMRDWRNSFGATPTYRIGNTTFRFHYHIALMAFCFGTLILLFVYAKTSSTSSYSSDEAFVVGNTRNSLAYLSSGMLYNQTYPLSSPMIVNGVKTFHIGLIADLDEKSADPDKRNTWHSFYKKGRLSYSLSEHLVTATFDAEPATKLTHQLALKGRGMELSELVTFNGRILTFDDRTGTVYELVDGQVIPWVMLQDGNGRSTKGFKSEWATVKDDLLYVGSMGKEWTTSNGDFENIDPMWVKTISVAGCINHINWEENYKRIRGAMGIQWPGYMIHESGLWSNVHKKWFFLPRRCSKEKYNETKDEYNGCNRLISSDESFENIQVVKLGEFKPTHGFSSMKFLPGTADSIIVALLTEELNQETSTYITAFMVDGTTLLPQQKIDTTLKYEGIEFI